MSLEALLDVQQLDTVADQLRHRRANLPERAALRDLQTRLTQLERRAAEVQRQRDAIASDEASLEAEITSVRDKAATVDKQLYSGVTNVPKELEALQHEIGSLRERQRGLEDRELELMEKAEPLDAELSKLASDREDIDRDAMALTAQIAELESEIDGELAKVTAERDEAVVPLDATLVAEYERLRGALAGIGVARLTGNRCEGCHLTLSAVDIDRIRKLPPDERVYCTECGRLLVR